MSVNFKFFPFKDFIFSVVPTAASYEGYLKDIVPLELLSNKFVELGVGAGLSLLLALVFYRENLKSYKKSLAEILATGYFSNFTGRLGRILDSKKPLTFVFTDNKECLVNPENIEVYVKLPDSLSALKKYSSDVKKNYPIAYLKDSPTQDPLWVRGMVDDDGKMTIYEYPRTLFALPSYLKKDFSTQKKAEKNSIKLFAYFKAKIEGFRIEFSQDLDEERIRFSDTP
ncbi:STING domain-containing protein [Lentiprolixibacter aurantiacus]|uniref:Prokaryotic STING domain-containing protein n=1 Tax=Lentiprolixibacter aurantiacus TaxID=2993939 RepID=A0AAE3MMD0_9FLAO|nr:STING domain-containing protein [Lentiprolixibacter aurantiacus]MCX2720021.1 hypothetical protein [Lentiprolixibacter aurantiacus]